MLTPHTHHREISAYPGGYTPVQFKSELLEAELSKPHKGAKKPAYNICETSQYYKIELAAPGLQREDFFITITDRGCLSISALHKQSKMIEIEKYRKHTFNFECFNREFLLPENIDTDFLKAEYRKGILSFLFLKTKKSCQKRASTVIVY